MRKKYSLIGLVPGKARAPLLVVPGPLSVYGEIDRETGSLRKPWTGSVAGRILVFERHRGSTVAPYILYGLARRGRAPLGLVVSSTKPDPILVASAVMAGIPLAAGLPRRELGILAQAGCDGLLVVEKPRGAAWLEAVCAPTTHP